MILENSENQEKAFSFKKFPSAYKWNRTGCGYRMEDGREQGKVEEGGNNIQISSYKISRY